MTEQYRVIGVVDAVSLKRSCAVLRSMTIGIETVTVGALTAILVRHDTTVFADRTRLLNSLVEQHQILESLDRVTTVVPASFNSLALSRSGCCRVLEEMGTRLTAALSDTTGRAEWQVSATWDSERFIKGAHEQGAMSVSTLEKRRQFLADTLYDAIIKCAIETIRHATTGPSKVLEASILVERTDTEELENALGHADRMTMGCLSIKLRGPVPPISFSALRIRPIDENVSSVAMLDSITALKGDRRQRRDAIKRIAHQDMSAAAILSMAIGPRHSFMKHGETVVQMRIGRADESTATLSASTPGASAASLLPIPPSAS
ncbi:MAG: GvpL/GvpF family gas vesicle protein [Pseudomonadota bacterium]